MNRIARPAIALLLIALFGCQPSDQSHTVKGPQTDSEGAEQPASEPVAAAKPLQRSSNAPSLRLPEPGPTLPDFGAIKDVKQKKQQFFAYLEPMIAQENAHTQALRSHFEQLLELLERQPQLHPDDQQWLAQVNKSFRIDAETEADQLHQLLAKVDQIPAALVKAQAANESAWGTSRFARQANNLFGQWCFTPGCGIAPLQRGADQTHEVEAFDSVAAGIRSYFTNLNGNKSYSDLRQIRRCLRNQQQPLRGRALAAGLTHYSARGGHYVDELQSMIRINKLEPWAASWWGDSQPKHPCYQLVQVENDQPDPILVASAAPEAAASTAPTAQQPESNPASGSVASVDPTPVASDLLAASAQVQQPTAAIENLIPPTPAPPLEQGKEQPAGPIQSATIPSNNNSDTAEQK
ncbi:hypothetical protein DV711_11820 [Motiliproteus coralliicola]|uniref:Mannosyl-glycoprotein endo-beta-N-acetylglucosamidase-like domain-containing protein n=1 Tax=Motiliproteus coralliicola TaxID=2283196 RepID=A0A369WEI1_9GAMM|nr:glucosaminidase domain-containing protein [Motiliproteus coralliicola]RDE19569.1 hypothetical protein DV711_11820 [Motiliproteus coralliicola]